MAFQGAVNNPHPRPYLQSVIHYWPRYLPL